MKNNEIVLPEGWEVKRLGDLCRIVYGKVELLTKNTERLQWKHTLGQVWSKWKNWLSHFLTYTRIQKY